MEKGNKGENLDAIINRTGYEIVRAIKGKGKESTKYKNFIDKALGVLINDGVYAYWVYCKKNRIEDVFVKEMEKLMEYVKKIKGSGNEEDYEKYFQNLPEKLTDLFFLKELLEKALIYARYHAKAELD